MTRPVLLLALAAALLSPTPARAQRAPLAPRLPANEIAAIITAAFDVCREARETSSPARLAELGRRARERADAAQRAVNAAVADSARHVRRVTELQATIDRTSERLRTLRVEIGQVQRDIQFYARRIAELSRGQRPGRSLAQLAAAIPPLEEREARLAEEVASLTSGWWASWSNRRLAQHSQTELLRVQAELAAARAEYAGMVDEIAPYRDNPDYQRFQTREAALQRELDALDRERSTAIRELDVERRNAPDLAALALLHEENLLTSRYADEAENCVRTRGRSLEGVAPAPAPVTAPAGGPEDHPH